MNTKPLDIELRQLFIMGLTAFNENSFPKKCESCNKIYMSRKDLLRETQCVIDDRLNKNSITADSNLKASSISDDIELCGNCSCGSELICVPIAFRTHCNTERSRRAKFGIMLESLVKHGIEVDTARAELINLLAGKSSKLIQDFALSR